jgi:xylan 1,4-beta-xylosidase
MTTTSVNKLELDGNSPGKHVIPYWKRMVCGDRAGLALRADYRACLATAVRECGFQNLRQHGMYHDDMFVWHAKDGPFNFQYLFSNYDYYLSIGLRPLVELSFLPSWMASNDNRVFSVKCVACPPNNFDDWHRLVHTTVKALVDRYGLDEVRSWHFEPWNEPDIAFWKGTQAEYFELYRRSVEAVKSVDAGLRIGGPATSNFVPDPDGVYQPKWVDAFMSFCAKSSLPVDFVSTHPYPTDYPFDNASQKHQRVVRDRDATHTDLIRLRKMVDAGPFPQALIHCNEWGSSPSPRDGCHDHLFSGTFLLENLLRCEGLVDSLARWVFCDVSEEAPPGGAEFHGGWGLLTVHGIRKPSFHAYAFLNRVGETVLHNGDGCAVFRSARGWQVLLFNHHHYANSEVSWDTAADAARMIGPGVPRTFDLALNGLPSRVRVTRNRVDREHGWALPVWQEMGSPAWPNAAQLERLHQAATPKTDMTVEQTQEGRLSLQERLDPLAMLLIEVEAV